MHFNGRFVLNLIDFASQLGADADQLVRLTGYSSEELCDENCRFGPEIYNQVVQEAVRQTGDPLFGLHGGENLNLAAAGLISQIAHTSKDVKEALDYCCEFANLGCSALPISLEPSNNDYKLVLRPVDEWYASSPESVRQTVYGYLAFTIREFQSLTRNDHVPIKVWLDHSVGELRTELERVTGCRIQESQDEIAIFFKKEHLELPVGTSDYALLRVLVTHAEERIATMKENKGFYEMVKRSVINMVKPEFPTIEQISAHLNLSVRTFQRKLKEEGYSYKVLLDELRKDFAMDYLKRPDLSINDIAYLLDYAEASAFVRSFKRWTGQTPNQFRKSQVV